LRLRPRARILIAGADGVSYGDPPAGARSYRELLQNELAEELDLSRVHFLGHISNDLYVNLLQISTVHVYWSYPFVLSWSFIEAMAAGCAIVGSATAPVLEVLKDGENGVAVDFFDVDGLAAAVAALLDQPKRRAALGAAARATAVREFDLETHILPQWVGLIAGAKEGRFHDPGPPILGPGSNESHVPSSSSFVAQGYRS
jgi:glycosyltransferase involved in cell wall biosynthesis